MDQSAANAALFFNFLSRHIEQRKYYNRDVFYLYKRIESNRDIFVELTADNKIIIGYKGIEKIEKDLVNILNHRHFDKYFSKIIIEKEKIYKEYLLRHNASEDIENFIEADFISESLSMLEIEYENNGVLCPTSRVCIRPPPSLAAPGGVPSDREPQINITLRHTWRIRGSPGQPPR